MISGILTIILIAEPVINEEIIYNFNYLIGKKYTLGPKIITSAHQNPPPSLSAAQRLQPLTPTPTLTPAPQSASLGSLLGGGSNVIVPTSTEFGIVIEKLNANAKVIPEVDPTSENDYSQALQKGVAHAKGTAYPGQPGNIYLFSHSTDAPWNIIRFNAIFYLLNKLDNGDTISLFYQGRRYDYIVFDKVITSPGETKYLTQSYDHSVLTLQTCDPPGTLLNRLVVRAKLASS